MRKSAVLAIGAALAVGGALFASAADKGTIKVASQTPLSGSQSVLGEAIKLGAQLAVEEYGGLIKNQGFKFTYQPEDDQANPTVGVSNANRLINDPDILAVVGHLNSGVAIPSSEIYAKVNLAMISPANTAPTVTDRKSTALVTNRVCGRDDVQGPAGADFAVKTLKAKRIYVLNDKTAYGQGLADAFAAAVKKLGASVVFNSGIDAKETDFSSIINRAKTDKPDLVYYGGIYDQGGLIIKQMREQGLSMAFMGGDGLDSSDLQKDAGSQNIKNVYFTTTSGPVSVLPAAKGFADRYQKKFGKAPEGYSAYGYDAMHVVILGIYNAIKADKGNKPTREQVAASIRKVSLAGLTGKIAFNDRGDVKVARYFVVQAAPTYAANKVIKSVSVAAPEPAMQ